MQKYSTMIRTLLAAVALMTVTAACAPKAPAKPATTERKLLQEKNATDIFAIPLDDSEVEEQQEMKKLESIGAKNEAKKEQKEAAQKAAEKASKK